MRLLSLIRHAKSSWKHPQLTDRERPLNARGKRDAPSMGRRFASVEPRPDLILTSPAKRAARTATAIAEAIGYESEKIALEEALYMARPAELLRVIQGLHDRLLHVALVGHNPGITELTEMLSDAGIENIPTCGIARLRLAIGSWREACGGCGSLLDFDYPKRGRR